MASKTLTISLPEELINFLDENTALSPSKVMQGALINLQESIKHNPQLIEAHKEIEKLKKYSKKLQDELQKATNFIAENGFWEEFLK